MGDIITYTFTVRNTGNVTVNNVVINDTKLGITGLAISPSSLVAFNPLNPTNPLAIGVATQDYVVKQADIDAGNVSNTATAIGVDSQGDRIEDKSGTAVDNDDDTVTTLPKSASLAFVKTGVYNLNGTEAAVGDRITYTFTVRNTGNVTVNNVVINDAKLGITNLATSPSSLVPFDPLNPTNPLAIGVATQEYIVTQDDVDARIVTNTAIAKGKDPQMLDVEDVSGTAVDNDDPTVTQLPENPKIALMLIGEFQDENNDGEAQIGETIKYNYTIMNMGDVPLSNVWIQDTMVGLDMNSGTINMPIGAMDTTTFTVNYSITQADIIAGNVSNQATVFGTGPLGVVVQDLSDNDSPLEDDSTVIGVEGCAIKVFNAVAPNEIGDNKILYIRGLDCYPNNTVQIFDRWGVKVYEVDGYDNNTKAFRGISEGRVTVSQSKGLPNGTYFYVLNYVDSNNGKGYNKAGYLHLIND